MKIKFLADMGISLKTVEWLRKIGYDAVHLREQNLQRLPDNEVLIKAQKENRVILTMDLDFGYLISASLEEMPLVIIFRLGDERSDMVNQRLSSVLAVLVADLLSGTVISVGDKNIRIRKMMEI